MGGIVLEKINLTFGNRVIFTDLNMDLPADQCTVILGSSGIGKTSILRLISGQIAPTAGVVWVNGVDVQRQSHKALYAMRMDMGYLYQQGGLFPHLSVFENVAFPLQQHYKLPERLLRDVVLLRLEAVGLRGAQALMPEQLSGGMKQRVALARATILDPACILYDEPFSGQDPVSKSILIKLIQSLSDGRSVTSVLVSHDIEESFLVATYVYVLLQGGIAAQGTPDEILAHDKAEVQQFIQGLSGQNVLFHYPGPDILSDLEFGE